VSQSHGLKKIRGVECDNVDARKLLKKWDSNRHDQVRSILPLKYGHELLHLRFNIRGGLPPPSLALQPALHHSLHRLISRYSIPSPHTHTTRSKHENKQKKNKIKQVLKSVSRFSETDVISNKKKVKKITRKYHLI